MSGTKRRRSRSPDASRKSPKYGNDEEDLEAILEMIRQQEESEVLARRLQAEFTASEVVDLTVEDEVVDLTEDHNGFRHTSDMAEPFRDEDDEAMARRLAREWGEVDVPVPSTSTNQAEAKLKAIVDPSLQSSSATLPSTSQPIIAQIDNSNKRLINPQDDLLNSRDMFIRPRSCTKCGKDVASPRNLVVFSVTIPPPSLLALLHCVCHDCGQSHCRGCFRALACPRNCKGKRCSVADCCAEVRAIALFETLGGFDRQYIGERLNKSEDAKAPSTRRKARTVGPGGTGYATGSGYGSEYYPGKGSRNREDKEQLADQKAAEASKAVAARWDDIVLRALNTIAFLLPSPYSDTAAPYDLLPHQSIRSLLSMSFLSELLGDLLINDSVTDWTDRSDVYNAMLKLLRRMADSELSVGTLIDQRPVKKQSVGLEDWMWGDGELEWETDAKTKEIIRAPPLFDHFKKLTRQCQTFLAGASHLLEDGGDDLEEVAVKATSLCGDMISAQQDMQRAISVMMRGDAVIPDIPNGKGKDRDQNIDMEKRYCTACEELAFKHVTLSTSSPDSGGLSYTTHHYAAQVKQTEKSTRLPSKRLHLVRELSVLSTSLPPGVWVRVDEVRNDVIKIMIAGPEGTPYAGGLFEFDCFIPLEYPDVSPKMNLCTTASGKVRFNPNLYNDGKVCLSLLGTWPGRPEEQWSSKSSLLQVLVSIQSMILVDAPFFNEPGCGAVNPKDPLSISYNKNIALQTTRWAMVDWMQEKHRTGIWADVIANHFLIRRTKILECVRKWAKEDPSFHNYTFASMQDARIPYARMHASLAPSAVADGKGQDLVAEIEQGCKRVGGWIGHQ